MTITGPLRVASVPTETGGSPLGVARAFSRTPLELAYGVFREHGDLVRVRLVANQYFFLVSHPDLVRGVLSAGTGNFTKAPHPAFDLLGEVMGDGLVTSDGDRWARQRRLTQPAFTRQRVGEYGTTMTDATTRMLDRWGGRPAGEPLRVDAEMMRLTLEIIGRVLFSMDVTSSAARVGEAFTGVGAQLAQFLGNPFAATMALKVPFLPSTRRFRSGVATLDGVVAGIVADRRADDRDHADLLTRLVRARDAETGDRLDDTELLAQVKTLLLSGYETTANTLSWTFHLLAQQPDVLRSVEDEVDAVLAGRVPTPDDLPSLARTKAVIQEALRLYPPIYMMARWGHEPADLGGHRLPAKANVLISPYVVHRHPEFWPDPLRFDPSRFESAAARHHHAYLPFGGGPRQCLGVHFSLMEAQLLLATVVQRYRLASVPGTTVTPRTLTTLTPGDGPVMTLTPRT